MTDRNDESLLFPSEEEKHLRILGGLADVDAGRTIPHAEARIWFAKMLETAATRKNDAAP